MNRTRPRARRRPLLLHQSLATPEANPPQRPEKADVKPFWQLRWRWLVLLSMVLPLMGYVLWLDMQVRGQFQGRHWDLPAQVYARPLELYTGMRLQPESLLAELKANGYRQTEAVKETVGAYYQKDENFFVKTRAFTFWDANEPSRAAKIQIRNNRVTEIKSLDNNKSLALLRLEPMLIGKIYPAHNEDRVFIRLQEAPKVLIQALIAVEDRSFYEHQGISMRGIIRASFANLRAGEYVQGGSTITQQLVKNLFLNNQRTFDRKISEAVMALLLEFHYTKDQLLETYLNEVYLGQDGDRAIHGMGMAAWFYFNRPVDELKLHESATLVSLIRAAPYYNPRRYPERAMKRRNMILDLMVEQEMITAATAAKAKEQPLGVVQDPPAGMGSPYPAFLELVQRQLKQDYREADLRSEGLQIFTTLDPQMQTKAEEAVRKGINELQTRGSAIRHLEGVMIVTGTDNGEIFAMVNGKNPRYAGFNRPLNAIRQIGSLVKAAIYLTALEKNASYSLSTVLNDSHFEWRLPSGAIWSPKNYDHKQHGAVQLHYALAQSFNLATVRLGMSLGLDTIIQSLQRLGIERTIQRYPSVLLGSLSLTPLEVTQMYQTIASGGFRIPLRSIRNVLNRQGEPLQRYALSVEQRFDAAPVFLLNYALQGAVRDGTGRRIGKSLADNLFVAGKTGTSNDLRDSWFAGYSSELLVVTWLGRDDNKPIYLSGGNGAMQVWSHFFNAVQPDAQPPVAPNRIQWRSVFHRGRSLKMPFIVDNVAEVQVSSPTVATQ